MESTEESPADEARLIAMADRLRELRVTRRLLQKDLESMAGVSVATIRKIENHYELERRTEQTWMRLFQGFGLEDEYLRNYQPDPQKKPVGKPEGTPTLGTDWDRAVQRIDEIVVERLKELVVTRLDNMEQQVRGIADVVHSAGPEVEIGPDYHDGTD